MQPIASAFNPNAAGTSPAIASPPVALTTASMTWGGAAKSAAKLCMPPEYARCRESTTTTTVLSWPGLQFAPQVTFGNGNGVSGATLPSGWARRRSGKRRMLASQQPSASVAPAISRRSANSARGWTAGARRRSAWDQLMCLAACSRVSRTSKQPQTGQIAGNGACVLMRAEWGQSCLICLGQKPRCAA